MRTPGGQAALRTAAGTLAGLLTAFVALGVAELAAAVTGPLGAPVNAVGETAINLTPVPVKDFAIAHFGSHDKDALVAGILVLLAAFAAVTGVLAVQRIWAGLAGLAAFGALGVAAALHLPDATAADPVPTLAGTAAAAGTLVVLARAARAARAAVAGPIAGGASGSPCHRVSGAGGRPAGEVVPGEVPAGPYPGDLDRPGSGAGPPPGNTRPGRRRFLAASAGAAALAAAAGGIGEELAGRFSVASSRARVRLPDPAVAAPAVPAGAALRIPGLTPFFTPNASFYRVDTDLVLPQVPPESWTLRLDGMVGTALEFSLGDLLRMPLTETDITLVCVSNEVGGTYTGNARWLGVPLAGLLRQARVQAGADQVLSASTDGMTISTPVATILDGRDALVAVGMNGQPLPVAHGFPARMVVPGLYGYVSATKWLTRLTLTTFARQKAYWTQRGYAARAPVKTESRIDVPRPLSRVSPGQATVAGVAWAPARGISAVEVRVDNGAWHQATLAAADGLDTWRQWKWTWTASAGLHTLQVRATDGAGATQTSQPAGVFPAGASGWDSVVVTVT